jgi:predicted ribosomally synthesized peptide with SipW-like signal peptide
MKKIIGLAISALILIVIVSAGTWAYYSDVGTATNNNIAAGTLDLKLGGVDTNVNIIAALSNKAPGDIAGDANNLVVPSATLSNTGSLPGQLTIQFGAITNTESAGTTQYEHDAIGGAGVGELGAQTQIAPWIDMNSDGLFTVGTDYALKSDQTVVQTALQWDTVNSFAGKTWTNVMTIPQASITYKYTLPWKILATADNTIQGDSFIFGITFTLNQIHL